MSAPCREELNQDAIVRCQRWHQRLRRSLGESLPNFSGSHREYWRLLDTYIAESLQVRPWVQSFSAHHRPSGSHRSNGETLSDRRGNRRPNVRLPSPEWNPSALHVAQSSRHCSPPRNVARPPCRPKAIRKALAPARLLCTGPPCPGARHQRDPRDSGSTNVRHNAISRPRAVLRPPASASCSAPTASRPPKFYSSQWCPLPRHRDPDWTGRRATGAVLNSFVRDRSRSPPDRALRQWIGRLDLAKPTVLVTHQVVVTLSRIFPGSGEIVVMQRTPAGQLSVEGRLPTA